MNNNIDYFSQKDSIFTVKKSKESSARVRIHKEFGTKNVYTLEMSYAGPNKGKYKY